MKKIYLLLVVLSAFTPLQVTAQEPYVGEIKMFTGNYAPPGWRFCNGDELPIFNNEIIYSIIGTTYGGDGIATFKLPDFRGRVPLHVGASTGPGLSSYALGQQGGAETVAITTANLPAHSHAYRAGNGSGATNTPEFGFFANSGATDREYAATANTNMATTGLSGNNIPFENMKPYLVVNFIIAVEGIYPTQN